MNSFFVFGIVLLATANNIAADVSIGSVANNSSHPVFELSDFFCQNKRVGIFNSLEGQLQPAEIDQLKNLIQRINSGHKRSVINEVLTTQVTWSVEEMEKITGGDFSALTASELNIVFPPPLKEEIERFVNPFQQALELRLKPGADVEKIRVFLTGLEDKVGDGSHNLKAYTYLHEFIFEYVTKQPGSGWVVNNKTFDEFIKGAKTFC